MTSRKQPNVGTSMSPVKAKGILEKLINNAAFLSGEPFGSPKRSEFTNTARGVLERSFPRDSSIVTSFDAAQSFSLSSNDSDTQLRETANSALSSELAVLRSAVEQLSREIEEVSTVSMPQKSEVQTVSHIPIFISHSSKDV